MYNVTIGVLAITDQHGRSAVGCAQDPDSPMRLGNVFTANGDPIEYDGLAGGVKSWAARNGLACRIHQIELDLESQAVVSWKILP
jgi:hypothetical protein